MKKFKDFNKKDNAEKHREKQDICAKTFDLELNQVINIIEVKNTKTNKVTVTNQIIQEN